jgi:holo-[acyl-carrier protein] synthase
MSVIGIGTDMVDVRRVERLLARFGDRFAARILTPSEQAEGIVREAGYARFLATRFAAKEATSKSLGTGIGRVSFHDMVVRKNAAGQPSLELRGEADRIAETLAAGEEYRLHLSITDEAPYALAFVILSATKDLPTGTSLRRI